MFAFFSGPKAPDRVPTDRVTPVGFFDNTIIFRTFVLYTLFVFDDVLDVQKLHGSLERLVRRPGWNKLGARLRKTVRLVLQLTFRVLPDQISDVDFQFRLKGTLSTISLRNSLKPVQPSGSTTWT